MYVVHLCWKVVKKQNLSLTSNTIHISLNSCSHNRIGAQFVQVTCILQFHPVQTTKTLFQHQSTEVTLLLLCTPQAHDIYIYIFRSIPKACHPIGVSSIFKKTQVLTSEFLAELDTPSFQHCCSNLSYTDGPQQYQFFTPSNYYLTKKDKRDWSQKTKGTSWVVAAFLFLCYYFSLSF